ncbi:MAG TPA: hypothetical protein P5137_05100 [Candidatus Brocadiia bacterium]|nr:hypothetical protein [Candidatus Brocadiia bacterium]
MITAVAEGGQGPEAPREKARRAGCLANLSQTSRALEAYCGDYSQYVPSNHDWGGWVVTQKTNDRDKPTVFDQTYENRDGVAGTGDAAWYSASGPDGTQRLIRTGEVAEWRSEGFNRYSSSCNARYFFRTIYLGWRQEAGIAQMDPGSPAPGNGVPLMGPNGLGFLIAGGYLGDARALFCPTAAETMPGGGLFYWQGPLDYPNDGGAKRLSQLQAAGGFGHRNIAMGN